METCFLYFLYICILYLSFIYFIYLLFLRFSLTVSVPIPDEEKKNELNFYFHTSLWYLKRFYEGLKSLDKTFRGTTKKCENKNLTYLLFQTSFQKFWIQDLEFLNFESKSKIL